MKCKSCGKEIRENSIFCKYCGNRIVDSNAVRQPGSDDYNKQSHEKKDIENNQQNVIGIQKPIRDTNNTINISPSEQYDNKEDNNLTGGDGSTLIKGYQAKYVLIGAIVIGLLIFSFVFINNTFSYKKIDVLQNAEVLFDGESGYGTVYCFLNVDYDHTNLEIKEFVQSLEVEIEPEERLSNNDQITVTVIYNHSEAKRLKLKVINAKKMFIVHGLSNSYLNEDTDDNKEEDEETDNESTDEDTIAARIYDSDGYIFEHSDKVLLTESDLNMLETPTQVRLATNELYARHHCTFKNSAIQSYFDSKTWYYPDYSITTKSNISWSSVEQKNIKLLQEVRRNRLYYSGNDPLDY